MAYFGVANSAPLQLWRDVREFSEVDGNVQHNDCGLGLMGMCGNQNSFKLT